MAYSQYFIKQVSAVLDYEVDWSTWLESGDTIATSAWSVPSGITQEDATNSTTTTTIIVSGGTVGQTYNLVNTITTANGLTDLRTIQLSIRAD